ncbi:MULTISPECIES: glycosyltransferase family 87 protein [unclassified Aminobacter]|jgi:hypothetical protein|uniref:glycosyltransferase family 87 protein n=1 Tax=unclassified Aminobacter TaxID=2644704 RepID=UPI0004AF15C5|nr:MULTISPECIES: glycosyltransferase family 87 protein [unclassified Aminobacter]TWH36350.1 uncharacterized protein DUF2029 [Aminobacter sp. J15]
MTTGSAQGTRFYYFIFLCGLLVSVSYHLRLWNLDNVGFSLLMDRLPYWDFSNLWAGGYIARHGGVQALFDAEAYRTILRSILHPKLPDQEWSYPPSLLLIGVPLSLLPIQVAYAVWTLGILGILWLALRPFKFPLQLTLAIIFGPAAFMNALFGQNGALTAALLLGGMMLAPAKPIAAGILIGLLTVKPHLGLLLPCCLLAGGHWRAAASATVVTLALIFITGTVFGFEVWPLFLTETRALMTAILEAPYPQHYHTNAVTGFAFARSLGADLTAAYLLQAALTLGALCMAFRLWRSDVDHRARVAATGALAIVATPYGYTYDLIPASVAVAWLVYSNANVPKLVLALFWLFPLFVHRFGQHGIGIGILPVIALAWLTSVSALRSRESAYNFRSATSSTR